MSNANATDTQHRRNCAYMALVQYQRARGATLFRDQQEDIRALIADLCNLARNIADTNPTQGTTAP